MNRIETLHVISGTIATLDDAQLSELYAYAVHMTKRETPPSVTEQHMDELAGEFVKGVLGMFASSDGQKDSVAPKRIAKRKRKVKA